MHTPATGVEAAARVTTQTPYHVLREIKGPDGAVVYEPHAANVKASSSAAAIRTHVTASGVYVAVPSRSFQPVKVNVKTQTVVTLDG